MGSFEEATALRSSENGSYAGALDPDWWGAMGPHGGYLAAILAQAALSIAGPRQQLRSLTIHYLQPAREGPIDVESDTLRGTRTATTLRLTMHQGKDAVAAGLAALVVGRSCPELEDRAMPDVTPYEETPVSHFMLERGVTDVAPPFATNLEFRQCLGPEPLSGGDDAVTGGWLKRQDGRPIDVPGAAMLMDAWWPAVWSRLRQVPRTPTVDLTIHFRRPLPETSEPLLAQFRSRLGIDGFVDEEGELWSADGQLLVQSRQLAVLLGGAL
jgi:acyl-coenzyme A thioesterase PaaI-like protein